MKEELIILSHSNPDVDSIISGYLLEKLLKSNNINASYIIPDKNIDKQSYVICKKYGLNPSIYQKELPSNPNLYLVDHNKTSFKGNIIGIIDHHPTLNPIICKEYLNTKSSSTAMLIYKKDPTIFNEEDIKKVILANLVDTISFNSTKTVEYDKEWSINMCKKYNFNYDELYNDGLCITDISNLNTAHLYGLKEYNFNNNKVKSSYIQVKDIDEKSLNYILDIIKTQAKKDNLSMWVFLLVNMTSLKTTVYLITDKVEIIKYDTIASRGTTVMPEIEKMFINESNKH